MFKWLVQWLRRNNGGVVPYQDGQTTVVAGEVPDTPSATLHGATESSGEKSKAETRAPSDDVPVAPKVGSGVFIVHQSSRTVAKVVRAQAGGRRLFVKADEGPVRVFSKIGNEFYCLEGSRVRSAPMLDFSEIESSKSAIGAA